MMLRSNESKADIHVHSKHSDRPSEWFLRRIGAPESFTDPLEIYRVARQRGMDFVTISDHNCIRGVLEIAHLENAFLSSEITTYFPEDGCKIHVLLLGINEEQFRMIQELRANIYELHRYITNENLIASVTHPLYRVNGRLTIDHVEKLLLMFDRFEEINGMRDRRATELIRAIFRNLTPEIIAKMVNRHRIDPAGPLPWRKCFTGGSDDHSGMHLGAAYTTTPYAEDVNAFLSHFRHGRHEPAGESGGSVMMGHSVFHIAYSYYKDRFVRSDGKTTILGELFKELLENSEAPAEPAGGIRNRLRGLATGIVRRRRIRQYSEMEQTLIKDLSELFSTAEQQNLTSSPADELRTFHITCRVGHALGYSLLKRFNDLIRQGQFLESLQTVASLGPVALSMAPYLAAFGTQHRDENFLDAITTYFKPLVPSLQTTPRKAWLTDTYSEINGVSRTIQAIAATARQKQLSLTVLTSLSGELPKTDAEVKNFTPVGTFPIPEYESQALAFPPFLEIIEYIEQQRFNELILSTPGPMGLIGLAAAKLLGLKTVGIYHTDFAKYVRCLTQDDDLADLANKYMLWFYDQVNLIRVPTECYRQRLIHEGFDAAKIQVMTRGIDLQHFQPTKRDVRFFERYGLNGSFKFLYAGRISQEKNVDQLVDAFEQFCERGHTADLVVVGDGPYRKKLQARCKRKRIAFTGMLEGEELAAAYASADAMVFPSTTDTFGNVVLEAQASGLPVIVSDQGGPAEIVQGHDSGIIAPHDSPKALVDAMEKLYLSQELRYDLRSRGLRNAGEFTWENALDDLWATDDLEAADRNLNAFRSPDVRLMPGSIALEVA